MSAIRTYWPITLGYALCAFVNLRADVNAQDYVGVFSPLVSEAAALSPDGRRLAYSHRTSDEISILTVEIDSPSRAKTAVAVAKDEFAVGYHQTALGDTPARITSLGWASPARVVVQSNLLFLTTRNNLRGVIFGFDHDGANASVLYSARVANGPVQLFGPIPGDSGLLLVRTREEWLSVDAISGHARRLDELAFHSAVRAFQTQRQRTATGEHDSLARLQGLFPGHQIDLLPHGGDSPRTLALVSSCADPGSFVVFDPELNQAWDLIRRAPAITAAPAHRITPFEIREEDGRKFTGTLVLPLNPRMKKAPLVLWLPESIQRPRANQYHPEVVALTRMGLAVAMVDGLASSGPTAATASPTFAAADALTFRHQRASEPIAPSPINPEEEMDHQLRACSALARHFPVSARAVAVLGSDVMAGFALETALAHPQAVRCVIALDPWFNRLQRLPVVDTVKALRRLTQAPCGAVFLRVASTMPSGRPNPNLSPARTIAGALSSLGATSDLSSIPHHYDRLDAHAKAAVFRDLEKFLTAHLYRYGVELKEIEVLASDIDLPQR